MDYDSKLSIYIAVTLPSNNYNISWDDVNPPQKMCAVCWCHPQEHNQAEKLLEHSLCNKWWWMESSRVFGTTEKELPHKLFAIVGVCGVYYNPMLDRTDYGGSSWYCTHTFLNEEAAQAYVNQAPKNWFRYWIVPVHHLSL